MKLENGTPSSRILLLAGMCALLVMAWLGASAQLTAAKSFAIDLSANTSTANIGDTIAFTIVIKNIAAGKITNITVKQSLDAPCDITSLFFKDSTHSLAAGASTKPVCIKWLVCAKDADTITEAVTAQGTLNGRTVKLTSAKVCVSIRKAGVAVKKIPDRGSAAVGVTVYYVITITNIGSVPLVNFKVDDSMFGDITGDLCYLKPGNIYRIIKAYTVQTDSPNPLINTVTVKAEADREDEDGKVCAKATAYVPRCSAGGGKEPGQQFRPDMMIYDMNYKNIVGANIYDCTGNSETLTQCTAKGTPISYYLRVENDDIFRCNTMVITGTAGDADWDVKYYDAPQNGKDITCQVTDGGWCVGPLDPNGARDFLVVVTPKCASSLSCGACKTLIIKTRLKCDDCADAVQAITVIK